MSSMHLLFLFHIEFVDLEKSMSNFTGLKVNVVVEKYFLPIEKYMIEP